MPRRPEWGGGGAVYLRGTLSPLRTCAAAPNADRARSPLTLCLSRPCGPAQVGYIASCFCIHPFGMQNPYKPSRCGFDCLDAGSRAAPQAGSSPGAPVRGGCLFWRVNDSLGAGPARLTPEPPSRTIAPFVMFGTVTRAPRLPSILTPPRATRAHEVLIEGHPPTRRRPRSTPTPLKASTPASPPPRTPWKTSFQTSRWPGISRFDHHRPLPRRPRPAPPARRHPRPHPRPMTFRRSYESEFLHDAIKKHRRVRLPVISSTPS